MIEIVSHPIDTAAVAAAAADPASGATVTFAGTTRDHNAGRRVLRLEYEAYPEMALEEMRKIAATVRERWPIERIAMVHRIGAVPIGEASVVIAVSAAHRVAAFEACHWAIDRLKEVVPIWKKEYFEGGEVWIGSQTGCCGGEMHDQARHQRGV
jgi:molybdopterin synthase catalytic subunit